jgi:putative ABC transport system permease protein
MVLALSAVVVSVTTQRGYSLVLAPEGVPAIQVNYWAFLGPGLFWIGAGLMIWRLVDMVLRRARPTLSLLAQPVARNLADVATATLSRRRAVLSRATVLLGLALAFAASTSIFNATYQQQAEVDAQLTNGADVAVHEPPGSTVGPELATGVARTPGVIAVEPLQHRFAYVGADLQDLYGVQAGTISQATTLEDAYFQNGTAAQLLHRLENQADAVLVSAETVADFQLQPGDVLNLRLPSAGGGSLVTVPFHYAGVVNEFPTAPKDSFLVANANYVAEQTGDSAVASFLVDTDPGIAETVADALRQSLGPTATVTTAEATRALIGSSLTSVDLQGLTRIELAFAVVLAAAAGALVFILGLHERKRSAAIASVLGGTPRQLRDLALVEAFFVIIGGLLTGSVAGALLTWMLVAVLAGVFDPPPAALAVPWEYLASVVLIAAAAIGVAALASTRFGRHKPTIEYLRDL